MIYQFVCTIYVCMYERMHVCITHGCMYVCLYLLVCMSLYSFVHIYQMTGEASSCTSAEEAEEEEFPQKAFELSLSKVAFSLTYKM